MTTAVIVDAVRTAGGKRNGKLRNWHAVDLASEPDSFKRQKEALMRYARYLKRVPTLDEVLKYLQEQNLFTGPWEQNEARRHRRLRPGRDGDYSPSLPQIRTCPIEASGSSTDGFAARPSNLYRGRPSTPEAIQQGDGDR